MNDATTTSTERGAEGGQDRVSRYVGHLLELAERDDRAALAALRHSLQEPRGFAMSACPYVVPFLGGNPGIALERAFFLVGALFALHPEHRAGVSLGDAFRQLNETTAEGKRGADNPSLRSRFVALLDAHQDDVAEHLRHAVSLARAHAIALDWVRLCRDLRGWGAEDRWVQRRLASDFWERSSGAAVKDETQTKSEVSS